LSLELSALNISPFPYFLLPITYYLSPDIYGNYTKTPPNNQETEKFQKIEIDTQSSLSPLTGEGLPCGVCFATPQGKGEGIIPTFGSPSPQSPPAKGGEFLWSTLFNIYFCALDSC
jgi:hypothetical protein